MFLGMAFPHGSTINGLLDRVEASEAGAIDIGGDGRRRAVGGHADPVGGGGLPDSADDEEVGGGESARGGGRPRTREGGADDAWSGGEDDDGVTRGGRRAVPAPSLFDLLDDDSVLPECRSDNSRLVGYFCRPGNLRVRFGGEALVAGSGEAATPWRGGA